MKNVIITGSSSGFGLQAAKDFADKGYYVFATMRNPGGKNASVKAELEEHSAQIKVVEMDVTDDSSVQSAFADILAEEGKVDILINNAGIMYVGVTEAYSVEQAHQQMNTNYYGIIRVTQAVLPTMRKAGKGLIINTTSVAGRVSWPFFGTYNATKFAVEGYSQALKYEVAPKGIEVVLVEPGPFGTGLIGSIQPEERTEVVAEYSELNQIKTGMIQQFEHFLNTPDAPQPQLVVDAYLDLAEMERGTRPTRTVVGLDYGAFKMNELTQPLQDEVLNSLQLEFMLETKV
ncbi:SDR family oxidoreductase [Rhodohalobacter mucosus]|nr:SDR family oxidoreductase [Rhodohalobacter mucosus]